MNTNRLKQNRWRYLFCFFYLFLPSGFLFAQEAVVVPWAIFDFPPFFISQEEGVPAKLVGQGRGDKMITMYENALPEFKFDRIHMNMQRTASLLNSGENLCVPSQIFTPERNKNTYFTYTQFSAPRQLITTAAIKEKLHLHNGAVSLKDLMQNPQYKGTILLGRSYGERLDKILRPATPNENITEQNSSNIGKNILRMVALGRTDYTVDYTITLKFIQSIDKSALDLVAIPIIEEGWNISMVGVTCTRNAWGKNVIEKLDAILPALLRNKAYRDLLEEIFNDTERKALREKMDAFYLFRGEPGKTNTK